MSHSNSSSGSAASPQQYSLAVITFWLAFGTFMIGCSEFAAMGLLPYFAEDFAISEKVAGHAISAYALGVVIGAPLITLFSGKISNIFTILPIQQLHTTTIAISA